MPKYKKHIIEPDSKYNNVVVSKLINYIMERGKKTIATRIVYDAFDIIKEKTKQDPVEIFEKAIQNASPVLEVRSKRIGGANYQVPMEVSKDRRIALAFRWVIAAAKKGNGPMKDKLAKELIQASNSEGEAIKKKENVHKMAEANKAFAHFAW